MVTMIFPVDVGLSCAVRRLTNAGTIPGTSPEGTDPDEISIYSPTLPS